MTQATSGPMELASTIRKRRNELNYTQEQTAREVGVSLRTYTRWESGATPGGAISVEALKRLATVLKLDSVEALYDRQSLAEAQLSPTLDGAELVELTLQLPPSQARQLARFAREADYDRKAIHAEFAALRTLRRKPAASKR